MEIEFKTASQIQAHIKPQANRDFHIIYSQGKILYIFVASSDKLRIWKRKIDYLAWVNSEDLDEILAFINR